MLVSAVGEQFFSQGATASVPEFFVSKNDWWQHKFQEHRHHFLELQHQILSANTKPLLSGKPIQPALRTRELREPILLNTSELSILERLSCLWGGSEVEGEEANVFL